MLSVQTQPTRRLLLVLCTLGALLGLSARAAAQGQQTDATGMPTLREYKGVRLGMSADEARQKLGAPQDKSDVQDFYIFSDTESAQLSYDAQHNVQALAVFYTGADNAPAARAVLGADLAAKPDGSMYRMVRYPKAGCWVSFSRTSGDAPMVTVMMQKYTP